MLQQIKRKLEIPYTPSAVQFRFEGDKGMVSQIIMDTGQKLLELGGGYFACLRPSQKKFNVTGEGLHDFDIVNYSTPAMAYLHRPAIAMLDSLAKKDGRQEIVRKRIFDLCYQKMSDLLKALTENGAFLSYLEKMPQYVPVFKFKSKNLLYEKFFRSMVEAGVVTDASKFYCLQFG